MVSPLVYFGAVGRWRDFHPPARPDLKPIAVAVAVAVRRGSNYACWHLLRLRIYWCRPRLEHDLQVRCNVDSFSHPPIGLR